MSPGAPESQKLEPPKIILTCLSSEKREKNQTPSFDIKIDKIIPHILSFWWILSSRHFVVS